MAAHRRHTVIVDRWGVRAELPHSDLEELVDKLMQARCRKVVVIETTESQDIVEAVA